LIWTETNLAQTGPKPTQPGHRQTWLYIVPYPNDLTSTWTQTTRHRPGLKDSTLTWARTTRHQPGLGQLDIGPGPNDYTSSRARMTLYWSKPEQINIGLGPNSLTSEWAQTTRHRPRPAQLNINSGPSPLDLNGLDLKSKNVDLDNYGLDFVIWFFCPPLNLINKMN